MVCPTNENILDDKERDIIVGDSSRNKKLMMTKFIVGTIRQEQGQCFQESWSPGRGQSSEVFGPYSETMDFDVFLLYDSRLCTETSVM